MNDVSYFVAAREAEVNVITNGTKYQVLVPNYQVTQCSRHVARDLHQPLRVTCHVLCSIRLMRHD